jgi:hypothetical protein
MANALVFRQTRPASKAKQGFVHYNQVIAGFAHRLVLNRITLCRFTNQAVWRKERVQKKLPQVHAIIIAI